MKAIVILCAIVSHNAYSQVKNDSVIFWSSSQLLMWSDFQGSSDSVHHTFSGRRSKAISATGIKFFYIGGKPNQKCYKLKALFYCSESWRTGTSEALLNHERGHFNLTEICARRLRKHLLKLSESCEKISLDIELELALDWYDSANEKYDQQTVYGINEINQNVWDNNIRNDLLEMNAYSDLIVMCSCNK